MHSDGAEVLFLVVFLWGLWPASRLGALYDHFKFGETKMVHLG